MRKELEDKIFRRWPDWFRAGIDGTRSLMGFGYQCGDGWFDILWRCFEAIEPSVSFLINAGTKLDSESAGLSCREMI